MATLTIPTTVQQYFPAQIDPSQLWVQYSPAVDSLVIYFTGQPIPTVWEDVDLHAYIGYDVTDETVVTGVMIEQFSKWLLAPSSAKQPLSVA
jgi:hypothetical protein